LNSGNFYMNTPEKGKYQPGMHKLRVLVAPLDWGLGHATRCIPVIYKLIHLNCDVWIATDGAQETLLRQEFPNLSFLSLPGYDVKYGRSAMGTLLNIFIQSQKILWAISYENNWLKKMVREHAFDAVISDNRYGLHHANIPAVFITHQLNIKSPWSKWTERWLQKKNYTYINRFTECWVPDIAGDINLAGELSHPLKKPKIPVRYIGMLSRLVKTNTAITKDHLLIILSGPEPQRSIFENKIIQDIAHYPGTATIVRGLPGTLTLIPSTNSIKFYNHLTAEELNAEMNNAEYIISRSGYSTIMDIIKLQKKSILVPTPGQTEQVYLANYLQEKKIFISIPQKSFSLIPALQAAKSFSYTTIPVEEENNLQQIVTQFVHSLATH
jgi:uncharacterized protein (TIGR00661 family)